MITKKDIEGYRIFAVKKGEPVSSGFDWENGCLMFGNCPHSPAFKDRVLIGRNLHFVEGKEITQDIEEILK
jgi:hypothetical protein